MSRKSSTKKSKDKKRYKPNPKEVKAAARKISLIQQPSRARARTGTWEKAFFAVFEATGNVMRACRYVGVDRSTVYVRRGKDKDFASQWEDSEEALSGRFEQEAIRRATIGVPKGIWFKGVRVGTEYELSDRMLELLLKKQNPRFREADQRASVGSNADTRTIRLEIVTAKE